MSSALSAWLSERNGCLPRSLAIDGKAVNDTLGCLITLCEQRNAPPPP